MEQISWAAGGHSTRQKIRLLTLNLKIHYCVQKNSPVEPVLRQLSLAYAPFHEDMPSYYLPIYASFSLFLSDFPKTFLCFSRQANIYLLHNMKWKTWRRIGTVNIQLMILHYVMLPIWKLHNMMIRFMTQTISLPLEKLWITINIS